MKIILYDYMTMQRREMEVFECVVIEEGLWAYITPLQKYVGEFLPFNTILLLIIPWSSVLHCR